MERVIVDQSDWGQLRVTGADRTRFLQGMLTNDVGPLGPGAWLRAALLNVKGRVQALVDVVAEPDGYLVLTEPATAAAVAELLDRYAIADDVAFAPEARPVHRVWAAPADVWTAPPRFAAAAAEGDAEARRVEAGLPRYGVDVSDENFPFEANLDGVISYTKGCYIGQEVVARAHARGHANKRLVGLRLAGAGPVERGSAVTAAARAEAGTVTSSVVSPVFGPIALAYIHKSAWAPGTEVAVAGRAAVVCALPFDRPGVDSSPRSGQDARPTETTNGKE
jgi:folate-binding protein YgfZ